jgi:hypothetical protein
LLARPARNSDTRRVASPVAGFLRRFAAARLVDAGIRKDLLLDTLTPSPRNTPVVAKSTR